MKPIKAYLVSWLGGSILNAILLVIICSRLHFNYKSAVCVYLYGMPGFFVKGAIAYTSYLFINHTKNWLAGNLALACVPPLLYYLWFDMIISNNIEWLYTDIEFGYTARLPHFVVQSLTTFVVSIFMIIFILEKKYNQSTPL